MSALGTLDVVRDNLVGARDDNHLIRRQEASNTRAREIANSLETMNRMGQWEQCGRTKSPSSEMAVTEDTQ